jgi:tetratricopeptide (TPR) repeat protein
VGELVEDLRAQVAAGQVVVVVGAGVSVAATGRVAVASWQGLLEHGIVRVEEVCAGRLPKGWAAMMRPLVASGDVSLLIGVAEQVTERLGGRSGGEFRRWLRESVGALRVADRRVLDALVGLGVPVATTNYDGLLQEATGWPAVTWRDGARVQRVIRGDEPGVVHLHGHWGDPESVVLGIRSYQSVLGDAAAQAVQRALAIMRGLLLVGFGAGLADPNFDALRKWLAATFPGSEYRHFRLCRDGEVKAVAAEHVAEERILPVGYGRDHRDLPAFLESLAAKRSAPQPTRVPSVRPAVGARGLPAPRPCVGRDELIARLVADILAELAAPVLISGAPGIGKTALSIAVLHDPPVVNRFTRRRWFVRADGAADAGALLAGVATELQLTAVGDDPDTGPLLDRVRDVLRGGPGLLLLDNLETPWTGDPLNTEELLRDLAAVDDLVLVASIRGLARPSGVGWADPVVVPPLGAADARTVFLAVAGQRLADDPRLDGLVAGMDGMPLAVELLGCAAQGEPDLAGLTARWQAERSTLLARAGGQRPEVSVPVSIELSIGSAAMTEPGQRLLALLGQLPDGIHHADLSTLLPKGGGWAGATTLRQLGLAYDDENHRLRTLGPIRDHLAAAHAPDTADLDQAIVHYSTLAADLGGQVGRQQGAAAAERLAAETGNLTATIGQALTDQRFDLAIPALEGLARYVRFTGAPESGLLQTAIYAAQRAGEQRGQAKLLQAMGEIALARSNHETARSAYERAQPLYEQVGDVLGQANCIRGLGDIALARGDHDQARSAIERARSLYEQIGAVYGQTECIRGLGNIAFARADHQTSRDAFEKAREQFERAGDVLEQAHCIKGLGDIALARSEHDTAREAYQQARPLYDRVGSVVGQAHCIRRVGDIALARSDYDAARAAYQEARPLYDRVGNVLGRAHCVKDMGDVALARSDYDAARAAYQEARPLYDRVGNVLGQANCIKGLGDVALARSDYDAARAAYQEARPLYERIGDVLGQANCTKRLGDIAFNRAEHDAARAAYQEARPLYERVGSVLGQANCIKGLGDVALARSDYDAARAVYEDARSLYERVGSVLGQANCIKGLGDVALARSDYDAARAVYEEARSLYERIGDVSGLAKCIQALGDTALAVSDTDTARTHWKQALDLYEKISEPYSIGVAHRELARIAPAGESRAGHVAAARVAWTNIHRPDLVAGLDEEFADGAS